MNNQKFLVFILLTFSLGIAIGLLLSMRINLENSKILNIIGLIYNILGIVILSEILITNSKAKKIVIEIIAPGILWMNTIIPLGVFVGALISINYPSRGVILKSVIPFWIYSIISLSLIDVTVVFPRLKIFNNIESRWRFFGLFLFLSGAALQLVGAIISF